MASEIVIPRLGWSMEEGTFIAWLRKSGDQIQPGDTLFELEGEKAVQEIESVDAGILHIPSNAPQEGTVVKVGSVIGFLLAEGETAPSLPTSPTPPPPRAASQPQEGKAQPTKSPSSVPFTPASSNPLTTVASPAMRRMARERGITVEQLIGSGPGGRILPGDLHQAPHSVPVAGRPISTPRARRIARELGIDWTRLTGTGTRGRIREQDVRAAVNKGKPTRPSIVADPSSKRIPVTTRRRVIAERMLSSAQQTAPVTLHRRIDAAKLVEAREQLKRDGQDLIPTYQDMLLQHVGRTLVDHPLLAAIWDDTSLIVPTKEGMHVGIAVDTPDGLLVPVVRDVARKSLAEIAAESKRLIELTRTGKLPAQQMQGGVFTLSNLGAFGVEYFSPIINLPQTAILGLGAIRQETAWLPDGSNIARSQLFVSLTFDHRVIDGAPAARFLQDLARRIESP